MLLDFLHLSRNRYVYFRDRASKVGMLHWTWWVLTLALQGRLYRALHPKLYATRNLCMHDFLKLHHNYDDYDAYMGVQKERKSTYKKNEILSNKLRFSDLLWRKTSSELRPAEASWGFNMCRGQLHFGEVRKMLNIFSSFLQFARLFTERIILMQKHMLLAH